MASMEATQLLRAGVLEGAAVLVAGAGVTLAGAGATLPGAEGEGAPAGRETADALAGACERLGARVGRCALFGEEGAARGEEALESEVQRTLAKLGALDLLLVDAGSLHAIAASRAGARAGMVTALEASWQITRAVAGAAWIAGERPGRVVYLAPAGDGAEHAEATVAGLENLARTLSIEWARHGVTTVTVAPAAETRMVELAALCAYIASPAGAYFSGCLLDLRGAGFAPPSS